MKLNEAVKSNLGSVLNHYNNEIAKLRNLNHSIQNAIADAGLLPEDVSCDFAKVIAILKSQFHSFNNMPIGYKNGSINVVTPKMIKQPEGTRNFKYKKPVDIPTDENISSEVPNDDIEIPV